MKGEIVKILSDTHFVLYEGEVYPCKCRGKFRNQNILPLVGDQVEFEKDKLVIDKILPRKNEFLRPAVANIDQAFLITSFVEPDFSLDLLDKLISVMELHHVKAIICTTKEDLASSVQKKEVKKYLSYYKKLGYTVVSNKKIRKIRSYMANKTSVFTGQTGAGKSTLLNRLDPSLVLKTGEISEALGRGRHTTRHVEIFTIGKGRVLDTPGFSSLDFAPYSKQEIRDSFIDFNIFPCLYKDCFHTNESECAVKKAVLDNKILPSRYDTYIKLWKQGR